MELIGIVVFGEDLVVELVENGEDDGVVEGE